MPARRIGNLLASPGELQALSRQAQRLAELQQVLFEAVPPALSKATRVKNHRGGTLFLLADNAAVAAKLRQLAPRLLLHLQIRAVEVTGIRVEVQVKAPLISAGNDVTKRALPTDAVKNFGKLSDALPPSPLKSALVRLVTRRRPAKKT
ncbi:MAG: DUF721 domain-containing protein [Betaproteobacteria bacterium]|nr:DUF721 domain-containing protein [Betaproteobacteria bacterium]MBI2509631.1 DUF721 domain-containing protein [Betaproteobacteria bacterium]